MSPLTFPAAQRGDARIVPNLVHGATPQSSDTRAVLGLIVDVPDVFYDATLWRRWLFHLLGRLGAATEYAEFDRSWEARLVDVHCGRREYLEVLQSFLLDCGLTWAQVDEVEAASRIQRRKLELNVRALPGVARGVEQLSRGSLPLVAWADVPHSAEKLLERLERVLPGARFHAALTSFDLEHAQPDSECYKAALASLGRGAAETVYVSHDCQHLAAAAAAGLHTVAINHQCTARASHYLARFDELPALLDAWPTTASAADLPAEGTAT